MSSTTLRDASVQTARQAGLAKEIASLTGLSVAAVRGRLARAHGRKLLRNLFADVWSPGPVPRTASPRRAARTEPDRGRVSQTVQSPERTIHRVRQAFTTSCGVAVVAMFARVSHEEAMAALFPGGARVYYTYLYQLKRALDHFGVKYGARWSRFVAWDKIPTTSLVKVKWQVNGRRGFHWVVFQRRKDGGWAVIDPSPGRPGTQRLDRNERRAYQGVTYLPVEPIEPRGR